MRTNLLETAIAREGDLALGHPAAPERLAHVSRIGPEPAGWESLSMDCEAAARYRVAFRPSLLAEPGALAQAVDGRSALLVTTPTVDRLYGDAMRAALGGAVPTLVLDVREETKSMRYVETVCAQAAAHRLNRRGLLIGFGGGVVMDVVTVAASLIRRGVGHLRVPTTLIGQIDAGIGLKGAVNFAGKKSFVGCFHPPEQVLIDPVFLRSLPRRSRASGLAEAVKMGIVRDAALFDAIESCSRDLLDTGFDQPQADEVLRRSIWSMLDELRKNPFEDRTYERYVDFGHTFSPALESALGFDIQHGEAVAVDMALSSVLARTMGILAPHACERILRLLEAASLPIYAPALDLPLCREALLEAARHRGGGANLVVPAGIGRATFVKRPDDVPDAVLNHALQTVAARTRPS